jgi:hypothetical protein
LYALWRLFRARRSQSKRLSDAKLTSHLKSSRPAAVFPTARRNERHADHSEEGLTTIIDLRIAQAKQRQAVHNQRHRRRER